ncbi:MAG: hypothetical protein WDN46_07735 [Methylocella sp.]
MVHLCFIGVMDLYEASKAYVRHVCDVKKWAPSRVAAESHVSSTTLTRLLNKKNFYFVLKEETRNKIKRATGVDWTPFFSGEASPPESRRERSNILLMSPSALPETALTQRLVSLWKEFSRSLERQGRPMTPEMEKLLETRFVAERLEWPIQIAGLDLEASDKARVDLLVQKTLIELEKEQDQR